MISGNNKKYNIFNKIVKLIKSNNNDDWGIAKLLLISKMAELTPEQWGTLKEFYTYQTDDYLEAIDIQKFYYDKRKQETGINKGNYSVQNFRI